MFLELEGNKVEWENFTELLYSNMISLNEDEDDSLVWEKNEKSGIYSAKL